MSDAEASMTGLTSVDPQNPAEVRCGNRFRYARRYRFRTRRCAVTKEVRRAFAGATKQMKAQFRLDRNAAYMDIYFTRNNATRVYGERIPDFVVLNQLVNGYFDWVHSSEIYANGYDDAFYSLLRIYASPDLNRFDGRCAVVKMGENGECFVIAKRRIPQGHTALVVTGEVFSGYQHSRYVDKLAADKYTCSFPFPMECLEDYFDERDANGDPIRGSMMKRFKNKKMVVESGFEGNVAAFLRNDSNWNLRPEVVLDLKTGVPTVFFIARRPIARGEELTVSDTGDGFEPYNHQAPPAQAPPAAAAPAQAPVVPPRPHLARAAKQGVSYTA